MMKQAGDGAKTSAVKVGPWGGHGGTPRDMNYARAPPDRLDSITVRSGGGGGGGGFLPGGFLPGGHINGLSFVYVDLKGQSIPVGPWGTSRDGTVSTITLGQDEYVVEVSGTSDSVAITSLTLVTSTGTEYGPYGFPLGIPFSLSLRQGNSQVIGFFGRSAEYLNALGLYLAPRP